VKKIKEKTKSISQSLVKSNFFGSYPSLNNDFNKSYDVIIDFVYEAKVSVEYFYRELEFTLAAEVIVDVTSKSEGTSDMKNLVDAMFALVIERSDLLDYDDFIKFYNSADLDRDVLDYYYVLMSSDEGVDDVLEGIKDGAVAEEGIRLPSKLNNKEHNVMQWMLTSHGLAPLGPSESIEKIAKDFFNVVAKSVKDLAKKLSCGYLILNKVRANNYEYMIWNLVDDDFIQSHNLRDDMRNGVNKTNLARLDTVRALGNKDSEYDFTLKYEVGDNNVILDTHDGVRYRLMSHVTYGKTCPREFVERLVDVKTSTPRRLECYNKVMENVIKINDKLDLMSDEKVIWNNVNAKLAEQMVDFFGEWTKGKGLDYKVMKKAVESQELRDLLTSNLLSFLRVREFNDKREITLTMEYEMEKCIKQLQPKLIGFMASKKTQMKKYSRQQVLSFMATDLPFVLRQVFNSQANIFNAIIQKSIILAKYGAQG